MAGVRQQFDHAFAMAAESQRVLTGHGDKARAFQLLKAAIGTFLQLWPAVSHDERTKALLAKVCGGVPSCVANPPRTP